MDETPALVELFCGFCRTRFFVCSRHFRGQRYCDRGACRSDGQLEIHRKANARYQRSPEGRADHRDRSQLYRARKRGRESDAGVTDVGTQKIAFQAPLMAPSGLCTSMVVAPEAAGEGNQDESIRCDSGAVPDPNTPPTSGWPRRDHESRPASGGVPAEPKSDNHVLGRPVPLAEREAAYCIVCGCVGRFILPGIGGRPRLRRAQPVFRSRIDRPSRVPPKKPPVERCR